MVPLLPTMAKQPELLVGPVGLLLPPQAHARSTLANAIVKRRNISTSS